MSQSTPLPSGLSPIDQLEALNERLPNDSSGWFLMNASTDFGILNGYAHPVDGVTGASVAGKGSLYCDTRFGDCFRNTGTKASPVWTLTSANPVSS